MSIKNLITRTTTRGVLVGKKYSPQLLTAAGIVGGVTSAVLASKATLKAQPVVRDAKEYLEILRDNKHELDDKIYSREMTFAYVRPGLELAKIYGPALSVGSASILCIVSAQGIMQRRNAAITAAYVAVEKGLAEYRKRVEEALGSDKERELYYQTSVEDIHDTKNGKVSKAEVFDPNKVSVYAKFFDEYNPNWTKTPEYNLLFLKAQQNYFNDLLKARGHVFLNEVYDALGLERTQAGQIVGWVIGEGDNYIDFGIFDGSREPVRQFVNGTERSILLDFNVDGIVYDLI